MRVVFCGSGAFAIPSLEAIARGPHELAGVITQPPRPAGRGGKLRPTPVAEACAALGVEARPVEKINTPEAVDAVAAMKPDVLAVADFGQLIRKPVRDCAAVSTFNLHGSLLPELRGAAPINWAILRGNTTTGVTTFELVDKMDAGAIYLQASTAIDPLETAEELKQRLAAIGAEIVCRTLEGLAAGTLKGQVQDETKATAAPLLKKSDGLIDWTAPAEAVRNRIHGAWPWPGGQAIFEHADGSGRIEVAIKRAAAIEVGSAAAPGVLDAALHAGTGAGAVEILEIRPAGKRLMAWRDFVNGHRVKAGDRFLPPEAGHE